MKINAGMSFLEIEDLKRISVMHRRYTLKIFFFLKSKHKRSRISSAIGIMLTEEPFLDAKVF
jgi:hypothetical protein